MYPSVPHIVLSNPDPSFPANATANPKSAIFRR